MIYAVAHRENCLAIHFVRFVSTYGESRYYVGYIMFRKGMRYLGASNVNTVWSTSRKLTESQVVSRVESTKPFGSSSKLFGYKETPDGLCS